MQAALLAGRATSRWATSTRLITSSSPTLYRHFSSTRPSFQEAEASAPPPPAQQAPQAPRAADSLAGHISRFQQQQKARSQGPAQGQPPSQPSGTIQTYRSVFNKPATASSPPPPSTAGPEGNWYQQRARGLAATRAAPTDKILGGLGLSDDPASWAVPAAVDFEGARSAMLASERPIDVKYRLRPVVGRTVDLRGQIDVARGLAILNTKCATNKIKLDFNKQRFHERGGLRKKRLRMERWRVRFKDGFKATCSRVRVLAKQGW